MSQSQAEPFNPIAALCAVAFPGLGHLYLRQTQRGLLAGAGVLFLFLTGLFIGGVSCIDRRENGVWFLGQALVGPLAFGVDYLHQSQFKVIEAGVRRTPRPDEYRDPATAQPVRISLNASGVPTAVTPSGKTVSPAFPPYTKSIGRTNELGTLFTTIAGFVNLIVIIDAAFNVPLVRRRKTA